MTPPRLLIIVSLLIGAPAYAAPSFSTPPVPHSGSANFVLCQAVNASPNQVNVTVDIFESDGVTSSIVGTNGYGVAPFSGIGTGAPAATGFLYFCRVTGLSSKKGTATVTLFTGGVAGQSASAP